MSEFERIIADIFDRGAEHRLDQETEREQIARAQWGDQDATIALLYAYAPVLRSLASRHAARLGVEEARSVAVSGLVEAIFAFDLARFDGRLAGIAHDYVANALHSTATTAVAIPERIVKRYLGIMRRADNDYARALDLIAGGDVHMSRSVFLAVREALSANYLTEEEARAATASPVWAPAGSDAFTDSDDRGLARAALAACSPVQRDVAVYAYGFATGDPMSDGEVAEAISVRDLGQDAVDQGQSVLSRAGVQRHRTKGVGVMREALGVA